MQACNNGRKSDEKTIESHNVIHGSNGKAQSMIAYLAAVAAAVAEIAAGELGGKGDRRADAADSERSVWQTPRREGERGAVGCHGARSPPRKPRLQHQHEVPCPWRWRGWPRRRRWCWRPRRRAGSGRRPRSRWRAWASHLLVACVARLCIVAANAKPTTNV